jgi:protein O-mannosyl-transferase
VKKQLLLAGFAVLVFVNCLGNDFVGDDVFVIAHNPFYQSLSNLPKLFTNDYLTNPNGLFNRDAAAFASGSVAYRPALSVTYFFDMWLWGPNPLGFHLTNILIHAANVLLVFWIAKFIFACERIAFLAALIFGLHPLKTEAVASIGYRADALSALGVLLAFWFYVSANRRRHLWSHLFFALAVLTKESAVIFPILLLAYDHFVKKEVNLKRYSGYAVILGLYATIYFIVFPNTNLNQPLLGSNLAQHTASILQIFSNYLTAFINPLSVKVLPPLYAPEFVWLMALPITAAFIAIFIYAKRLRFCLVWFLIALIPVLNIIPIANPMAYRFMYLPSVGLSLALAFVLEDVLTRRGLSKVMIYSIQSGLILLCAVTTLSLNFIWKNNYVMAKNLVQNHPRNPQGYLFLATEYFQNGYVSQAKDLLEQGFKLGLNDPRAYHLMGLCTLHDPSAGLAYYGQCIQNFPQYAFAHTGLGRILFLSGENDHALNHLETSLRLLPSYTAYGYTIQILLMNGRDKDAEHLLSQARLTITDPLALGSLVNFFKPGERDKFPIDIGI